MQTISERLKWARAASGLTTRELASAASVSPAYPSAIECGQTKNPSIGSLAKLSTALGVPLQWLCSGEGRKPSAGALRRRGATLTRAA